jgi:hypothetical protein
MMQSHDIPVAANDEVAAEEVAAEGEVKKKEVKTLRLKQNQILAVWFF